ncbi:nucleoid-associated protein YejK [Neiella marina]|uniref:Nucleoid-associated protein YejK n=1 Tax=Neiella marina TaxID=508461 RepID=A0A8J2XR10_9GAMM|nr:nucleoid-associated protein [Neiella marina]GGA87092.1 nucleoid-associated protein YejK [Neiella marina]
MSVELEHFIIHRIKNNAEGLLEPEFQQQEVALSDTACQLVAELHQRFNAKPSKGIGRFVEDGDSPFPTMLQNQTDDNFVEFSQQTCKLIASKMEAYGLANECYLLFAEYRYVAQHFLLISEVPVKEKVTCNENMEIGRFRFLDADALQLAIRFDLMLLATEQENFATFVKGRAGRKVADFFLDSMAIEELVDRKAQAEQLGAAVSEFCDQYIAAPEVQAEVKKELVNYCKERQDAGESVQVGGVSELISAPAEVSFSDFIASTEEPLPESMEPEIKTLKQLTRFAGTGKGVSISFDASLLGDRVTYDVQQDRLVITEIPPNLKDQLIRKLT